MSTQAFTANMESMRKVCDRALELPNGLEIKFTLDTCGSLEACATRARSAQTTFTSLRARARRLTLAQRSAAQHNIKGPYDTLICRREPMPDGKGWRVHFIHATDMFDGIEFTDPVTGERIESNEASEKARLIDKLMHNWAHFTPWDFDRLDELDNREFIFHDPISGFPLTRDDCDGQGATVFARVEAKKRERASVDFNARRVDLATALTPGHLFDEGGEDEQGA